ncbi:MAG TPA: hypothetical protein PKD00_11015, partial [Burkholderiales bacterium]|nr:hypothetical protein [Burkholderiales bacterium]
MSVRAYCISDTCTKSPYSNIVTAVAVTCPCVIDADFNVSCNSTNTAVVFQNITITGGSGVYNVTIKREIVPSGGAFINPQIVTYTNVTSPVATPFANEMIESSECLKYDIDIRDASNDNCRKALAGCINPCETITACAPISGSITDMPPSGTRNIYAPYCAPVVSNFVDDTIDMEPLSEGVSYEIPYELLNNPTIVAVGLGLKTTNGVVLNEIAYIVTVKEKLPLNSIPVEYRVSKTINGLRTDVQVQEIYEYVTYVHYDYLNDKIAYFNGNAVPSTTPVSCTSGTLECFDFHSSTCNCA